MTIYSFNPTTHALKQILSDDCVAAVQLGSKTFETAEVVEGKQLSTGDKLQNLTGEVLEVLVLADYYGQIVRVVKTTTKTATIAAYAGYSLNSGKDTQRVKLGELRPVKLTPLTKENGAKASTILRNAHPNWGTQRFDWNGSENTYPAFGRSLEGVLFTDEFRFWSVVTTK